MMVEKMINKKKRERPILLIWEEPPEIASFFLISASDISESEMRIFEACHNNLINSCDVDVSFTNDVEEVEKSLQLLSHMISNPNGSWINDDWKDSSAEYLNITREEFGNLLGKWYKYKLDRNNRPISIPKSKMILSGFIL